MMRSVLLAFPSHWLFVSNLTFFCYVDHSGTEADTENYNLLLRDLRMKLDELGQKTGRFYGLTAAMPCGSSNIANIDIATVAQYLTEFNLMTYGEYFTVCCCCLYSKVTSFD